MSTESREKGSDIKRHAKARCGKKGGVGKGGGVVCKKGEGIKKVQNVCKGVCVCVKGAKRQNARHKQKCINAKWCGGKEKEKQSKLDA